MSRMPCPITRPEFRNKAKALRVVINGVEMEAPLKEFSTGSFGWNLTGKVNVEIGGKNVPVQVGVNMAVIGSKDLPKE